MKFVRLAVFVLAVVALFTAANAAPNPVPDAPVSQSNLGAILQNFAQALANLLSNDNDSNRDPSGSK